MGLYIYLLNLIYGIIIISSFSWNSYKINQSQDKIGVFVSIVSTKIPFKGTGKEYIGDDITEISSAVKVTTFPYVMMVSGGVEDNKHLCNIYSQLFSSVVIN